MKITEDIRYIGVNDHDITLFEGQYRVENGMAYNSYIIMDEKIAVMDTVDEKFGEEWLDKLSAVLAGRTPDYLVVQHMEPDHSANICRFAKAFPQAKICASAKAFEMMAQFYGTCFEDRQVVLWEGSTLELGRHTLHFMTAAMVHWPEVIVTYDSTDKVLFTADGFGKFGALDVQEDWADEARRYYIGIVGKFGQAVQGLLRKASALDVRIICPLHGPVLSEDIGHYIDLYDKWSSYTPECDDVVIAYCSVYGNTKKAVQELEQRLSEHGAAVHLYDLSRCDMKQAVAQAFRCKKLVAASTTYNGGVFPCMREFLSHLSERGYQNRIVGFIENGTWAPMAARTMEDMLSGCINTQFAQNKVTLKSALNEESRAQLKALAQELCSM